MINGKQTTPRTTNRDEQLGRAVRRLLQMPSALMGQADLPTKVDSIIERLERLEHLMMAIGRRQEQFEQLQRDLTQAVRALYEKQGLLEQASQHSARLTDEHYSKHIILPLARQLIDCLGLADAFVEGGERHQREAMLYGLHDLLASYGIESITAAEHEVFDPQVMKPIHVVETRDAQLHRRVHSMVRPGYRFAHIMLRPVMVRVYRLQTTPA